MRFRLLQALRAGMRDAEAVFEDGGVRVGHAPHCRQPVQPCAGMSPTVSVPDRTVLAEVRNQLLRIGRGPRAGRPDPLSRGGRPVCCVSMRPGVGFTASFTGAAFCVLVGAALEFFLRALV